MWKELNKMGKLKQKIVMISGISGQDGSNLAEYLLSLGHKVIGLKRRVSNPENSRIKHLDELESKSNNLIMEYFDLADTSNIMELIKKHKPDYFINTAAMSHVHVSFFTPESTIEYNYKGVIRILEVIRHLCPKCRFLQCSSSEQMGDTEPPQNEESKMNPQSHYGICKLASYLTVKNIYRKGYGLFACNSICYNHEGVRRTVNFVTRKITKGLAEIVIGKRSKIVLGNLDAKRDWGDSKDYVRAMWGIVNHKIADDFIISTKSTHSIREFLSDVFSLLNLDYKKHIETNDKYKRPTEVPALLGDNSKILKTLNWKPRISYQQMIKEMLINDLREYANITGTDEDILIKAKQLMKERKKK